VGALVAWSGWDSSKGPAGARLLWWLPRAVQAMGLAWFGVMCTFSAFVEVGSVGLLVASSGRDSSRGLAGARHLWWLPRAVHAMGLAWFELLCTSSASVEVVCRCSCALRAGHAQHLFYPLQSRLPGFDSCMGRCECVNMTPHCLYYKPYRLLLTWWS
jgi:hypothetical protein